MDRTDQLLNALRQCSFHNVVVNDDVSCPNEMLTALRPWTRAVIETGERKSILQLDGSAIAVLARLRS